MDTWVDTQQAEIQEPKVQEAKFQLEALPAEHLWVVQKVCFVPGTWAQASVTVQSQDNAIWKIKILHFCLKTRPLYFSLTIFPMPWPLHTTQLLFLFQVFQVFNNFFRYSKPHKSATPINFI